MKKFNVKLLEKVKKAILKHPDNTDMGVWVDHEDDKAPCGTVGCIGGWVVAKANLRKLRKIPIKNNMTWQDKIQAAATKLLGINPGEAQELFLPDYWPGDLWSRFQEATTRKESAKIIAKRIDRFIKEKKANEEA